MNLFIILVTAVTSFFAFNNRTLFHKLKFNASYIRSGEWYRLFSGALVHADFMHLAFNMLALWFSGQVAEAFFQHVLQSQVGGSIAYTVFYIIAIPMSSLYSYEKHKDDSWYNAVGASGAVSAVLFCFVLLNPGATLAVYFIPMKAWIFAFLYLGLSWFMARRGNDNIGHDAHFFGAVFGVLVTVILRPSVGLDFIQYITTW